MENIVTIEDVARAASVGRGTVDRVIHNRGRVSEETRQKVLRCIAELGYQPNKTARMLANKRAYRIAVTFHDLEEEFWCYIKAGVDKAEHEYRQLGVTVDRYILPRVDVDRQLEVINHVIEAHYDGLAITPYCSPKITEAIDRAVDAGIEVVTFNNDEDCKRSCYIGQDMIQSGRTAGRLMSLMAPENGTYFVILPGANLMSALEQRYPGFDEIVSKSRKDLHLIGAFECPREAEGAYEITREILAREKVDAIYAVNGIIADVAKAVEEKGLQDQILLIGHDLNAPVLEYVKTGTINIAIGQSPEFQGYTAIDRLCQKLLVGEDISEDIYTKIEVILSENVMYHGE